MNYDGGRGEEIMKKNRLNMGKRRKEDVCSVESFDFENII